MLLMSASIASYVQLGIGMLYLVWAIVVMSIALAIPKNSVDRLFLSG